MSSVLLPSPVRAAPHVLDLLNKLHEESSIQESSIPPLNSIEYDKANFDIFMRNKFIALEQDKCHFVYQLIRATGATNIVEAGTSFGVSTIYLALAVRQNIEDAKRRGSIKTGKVIGTEYESVKAVKARKHWIEAGVVNDIELREGDLLETLKQDLPEIDLLLLDIWAPMALPTLKLVQPKLRPGAVILADNTISGVERYKDLFAHLRAPDGPFSNLTLPYSNGLEMSVFLPK